jgi:hypothetical protein
MFCARSTLCPETSGVDHKVIKWQTVQGQGLRKVLDIENFRYCNKKSLDSVGNKKTFKPSMSPSIYAIRQCTGTDYKTVGAASQPLSRLELLLSNTSTINPKPLSRLELFSATPLLAAQACKAINLTETSCNCGLSQIIFDLPSPCVDFPQSIPSASSFLLAPSPPLALSHTPVQPPHFPPHQQPRPSRPSKCLCAPLLDHQQQQPKMPAVRPPEKTGARGRGSASSDRQIDTARSLVALPPRLSTLAAAEGTHAPLALISRAANRIPLPLQPRLLARPVLHPPPPFHGPRPSPLFSTPCSPSLPSSPCNTAVPRFPP